MLIILCVINLLESLHIGLLFDHLQVNLAFAFPYIEITCCWRVFLILIVKCFDLV